MTLAPEHQRPRAAQSYPQQPRPRLRVVWWTLGFALLALITVLSLVPLDGPVIDLPSADKLQHAFAYIVLTIYFGALVGTRGAPLAKVIAGLVAYGIGIEIAQSMLPPRSAELADLAANACGMAIGALLLRTRLGRVLWGIEGMFSRRDVL